MEERGKCIWDFSGEKELVTFFLLGLFEIVASRWGLLIINPIYIGLMKLQ